MKKRTVIGLSLGAMVAVGLALVLIFFLTFPSSGRRSKVVIIGLDGAGWNFIDPLFSAGHLPNLKSLADGGSRGMLTTIRPTESVVIWTSIATGKSSLKHGILNFTYVNKNKIAVPFRQSERQVRAFWDILSEKGISVGVLNWFITYPAEKVRGFMVSDEFRHVTRKRFSGAGVTFPEDLWKTLPLVQPGDLRKILEENRLPDFQKDYPSGKLSRRYHQFVLQDKAIELASYHLFEKKPVEVFASYFRLVDLVSHFASVLIDPALLNKGTAEEKQGQVSPETRAELDKAYSRILEPVYSYADRIVGRFLQLAGPETTFIVVSDHSFYFYNGGYGHTGTPEIPHGIIILKGPSIKPGFRIPEAHIYDILPTLLYILDLPVGEDMDGQIIAEAFEESFLKSRAIRTTPTYEVKPRKVRPTRDRELDRRTLEELRALGYIK
jgi:predicted AlkP superfamily phosphohydrolase/phosphomutase